MLPCRRGEFPEGRFPLKHSSCSEEGGDEPRFLSPAPLWWWFTLTLRWGYPANLQEGLCSHPVSAVGNASPLSVKCFGGWDPVWGVWFSLLLAVSSHSPFPRSSVGDRCSKQQGRRQRSQESSGLAGAASAPAVVRLSLSCAQGTRPELCRKCRP